MLLRNLNLQNFRSYTKADFTFSPNTTYIVGPNTAGKSNLIEAIFLLVTGKSFRAEKDIQMVQFSKSLAQVKGKTKDCDLEVVIHVSPQQEAPLKKYLVNGVSKRRQNFIGNMAAVLFSPLDLEILIGSPVLRRRYLDTILEQTDHEYRHALLEYSKALRQRNALLELARESGKRMEKQFEYWDGALIKKGEIITHKRGAYINYLNQAQKDVFDFAVIYDKNVISSDRLLKYKDAELGAGVTLVGPHRDEFSIKMYDDTMQSAHDVRSFASRGQQRLIILQLKLLELSFLEKSLGQKPLLLLDDIFSELDEKHIKLVMEIIGNQQTIVTTTHEELIKGSQPEKAAVIKLGIYESIQS